MNKEEQLLNAFIKYEEDQKFAYKISENAQKIRLELSEDKIFEKWNKVIKILELK